VWKNFYLSFNLYFCFGNYKQFKINYFKFALFVVGSISDAGIYIDSGG
jgi:hypothetical protein